MQSEPTGSGRRRWLVALTALILLAATAVLLVVLVEPDDAVVAEPGDRPQAVTASELQRFAANSGQRVYWAGERAGTRLELTDTARRNVFVRYLTGGVEAGSASSGYVTVGTYPKVDAYTTVRRQSVKPKARKAAVPGGGLAVWNPASRSVYVGYPNVASLVEVYAPESGQAVRLVRDGAIVRVR